MKGFWIGFILMTTVSLGCATEKSGVNDIVKSMSWFGQSAIRFTLGKRVIYIDPFQIKKNDRADVIFISHPHRDHLDTDSIKKIAHENTAFVTVKDCVQTLKDMGYQHITVIQPRDKIKLLDISVDSVPAYNIVKNNHPKESGWVGFVFHIGDTSLYFTGDTERIPEMKSIRADIILTPLGQKYTYEKVEDAANAALDVGAKVAIPIHFGMYEGTEEDAIRFEKLLQEKVKVYRLQKSEKRF